MADQDADAASEVALKSPDEPDAAAVATRTVASPAAADSVTGAESVPVFTSLTVGSSSPHGTVFGLGRGQRTGGQRLQPQPGGPVATVGIAERVVVQLDAYLTGRLLQGLYGEHDPFDAEAPRRVPAEHVHARPLGGLRVLLPDPDTGDRRVGER